MSSTGFINCQKVSEIHNHLLVSSDRNNKQFIEIDNRGVCAFIPACGLSLLDHYHHQHLCSLYCALVSRQLFINPRNNGCKSYCNFRRFYLFIVFKVLMIFRTILRIYVLGYHTHLEVIIK